MLSVKINTQSTNPYLKNGGFLKTELFDNIRRVNVISKWFCPKWLEKFPLGQVLVPQKDIKVVETQRDYENYEFTDTWRVRIHTFEVRVVFEDGKRENFSLEYIEKVEVLSQRKADWYLESQKGPRLTEVGNNTYMYI